MAHMQHHTIANKPSMQHTSTYIHVYNAPVASCIAMPAEHDCVDSVQHLHGEPLGLVAHSSKGST
jgi:hypothetical protein